MTEPAPVYQTKPAPVPPPHEAACECGWKFGIVYTIVKRPPDHAQYCYEYLALYSCGYEVETIKCRCKCGKTFVYEGGRK